MVDEQLQAALAGIFVHVEPVDEARLRGHFGTLAASLEVVERDRVEAAAGTLELHPHLEVLVANRAAALDAETLVEARLGEGLAPGPTLAQELGRAQRDLIDGELAIGLHPVRERPALLPAGHLGIEFPREEIEAIDNELEALRASGLKTIEDKVRQDALFAKWGKLQSRYTRAINTILESAEA